MTNNNEWMQQVISEKKQTGWNKKTRQLEEDINISNEELKGSRHAVKRRVEKKLKKTFKGK